MSVSPDNRLTEIADLHEVGVVAGGGTTGYCCECDCQWPCRTHHIAKGWGSWDDCADLGWCHHASVALKQDYPSDYVDDEWVGDDDEDGDL